MNQSLFYFLSFVAIFCGLMVIFSKNPIQSALYLILTFFAIAGHYFLLNAQFLAIVQIIVYLGAIMVLFLFTIMLLNLNKDAEPQKSNYLKIAGTIAAGLLMLVLVAGLQKAGAETTVVLKDPGMGLVENLGKVLFGEFLLPFEIASILLLVAMVGAVLLASKDKAPINN